MLGFNGRQLFKASAIAALAIATISLLLIYFIPAPPSTVTMATAFKGSSFNYFGHRYRDIFARSRVDLKLRETEGAVGQHRASEGSKLWSSDCPRFRRHL